MSPELETLDQLLSGDLPLSAIVGIYSTFEDCRKGLLGLLLAGDVRLIAPGRVAVPEWEWRALLSHENWFQQLNDHRLSITKHGARKIE